MLIKFKAAKPVNHYSINVNVIKYTPMALIAIIKAATLHKTITNNLVQQI